MQTSPWTAILTAEQIDARFAAMAIVDPRMARESKAWWATRTPAQLRTLKAGAWDSNQSEQYQLAASYLALQTVEF